MNRARMLCIWAACFALAFFAGAAHGPRAVRCPEVDNAEYQGAVEREGKLQCVYMVNVTRQIARGLTKEEGGKR